MILRALAFLLAIFLGPFKSSTALHYARSSIGQVSWTGVRASQLSPSTTIALGLRAGSDDEYDSEDVATDDEEGDSSLAGSNAGDGGLVGTIIESAFKSFNAILRATMAAFDFSEVENDASIIDHIMHAVKRMWNAALNPSEGKSKPIQNEDDIDGHVTNTKAVKIQNIDFGSYLGTAYGVEAGRENLDDVEPILTGSFHDALKEARKQARLLVALVPAHSPKKKDKNDREAVESFLSENVATVARKKAKKGADTGSFVLWSAKALSSEAALAIKRLKVQTTNNKGKKRPTLLVVYPNQKLDNAGRLKMAPRLLAQHHCSPPPSAETMAAWLNALRKRHAKQYATMHTELKELELFHERKQGYKESVKADIEMKEKEEREAAERKAREEAEKKRAEEIRERREIIRDNLPEEPPKSDKDARTIALRLADGRSAQRRFAPDTSLETVFGWIDVTFEEEQENVTLTTMNGKLSFIWEDKDTTLQESGLPKMAALRVTFNKNDATEEDSDESN